MRSYFFIALMLSTLILLNFIPVNAATIQHSTTGKSVDVLMDVTYTGESRKASGDIYQKADITITFYKPDSLEVQPNVNFAIVSYDLDPNSDCPATRYLCRVTIPAFGSLGANTNVIDNGAEVGTISSEYTGLIQGIFVSKNQLGGQTFAGAAEFRPGDQALKIIVGSIDGKPIQQESAEFKFKFTSNFISPIYGFDVSESEKTSDTSNQNEQLPVNENEGGGCLMATATYGSELAPQVQQLRELRDNKLLKTESGATFMQGFNDFYYLFSPTIADWERENTVFKEAVKITITPLLTSLSLLNYVDMDSEAEVLGYGISLILLNIGMYFVTPVVVIVGIRKRI